MNNLGALSRKVAFGIAKAESEWVQGQMRRLLPESVFKLHESKDELELGTLRRHIVLSGIEIKVRPDCKELWQKGVPISRFELKWEGRNVKVNITELSAVPTPELTVLPETPINPDSVHLRKESVPPSEASGSENNPS